MSELVQFFVSRRRSAAPCTSSGKKYAHQNRHRGAKDLNISHSNPCHKGGVCSTRRDARWQVTRKELTCGWIKCTMRTNSLIGFWLASWNHVRSHVLLWPNIRGVNCEGCACEDALCRQGDPHGCCCKRGKNTTIMTAHALCCNYPKGTYYNGTSLLLRSSRAHLSRRLGSGAAIDAMDMVPTHNQSASEEARSELNQRSSNTAHQNAGAHACTPWSICSAKRY